jgi:ribosomal protein S18 acetylase RimI-like enzyme
MIRKMSPGDIPEVVDLYRQHMSNSFLKMLDKRVLVLLFQALLNSRYSIQYVYEDDSSVAGFIASSLDSKAFLRSMLVKNILSITRFILLDVIKHPGLLALLCETLLYFNKAGFGDIKAELLFIVVDPRCRKKGIAQDLVTTTLGSFKNASVVRVKVSIVKSNRIVSRLLEKSGFIMLKEFIFYNKENQLYGLTL